MGIINHHTINNGDIDVHTSEFPVEFNSEYIPNSDTIPIKSIADDEMDHLLEFFHSGYYEYLLDVDIYIIQAWLVVDPPSKFYAVSTVLFYKHWGVNVAVKKFLPHFSVFVPTKANVKPDNVNKDMTQELGLFVCRFPNCYIIYTVGPVYYFPGHPYNTI